MNKKSMILASTRISIIREKAIAFWLTLWDESTGGFRLASNQPATLMATAYCVLGQDSWFTFVVIESFTFSVCSNRRMIKSRYYQPRSWKLVGREK